MSHTPIGNIIAGPVPIVVGTISSREALECFGTVPKDLCDVAEVRLDEIGEFDGWIEACERIESVGVPTMTTIRLASEGGKWARRSNERLALFDRAIKTLAAVDVEFKSDILKDVSSQAKAMGKAVIVSFHDFNETPTESSLLEVIKSAAEHATVVKVSTMVRTESDIATLKGLLDADFGVPLCVIGMGALGTRTRTAFPVLGSALTYGYLDAPSAPGQLPATILVDYLRLNLPAYNQQFVVRKEILEFA